MQASQHRLSNVWYPLRGLNCWFEINIVFINRIYRQLAIWNTLREHLSLPSGFWWGPCCSSFYILWCHIMCLDVLSSLCCPLRCPHKTMFGSSLPPVVCRRADILFTLYAFVCLFNVQHILWCVFALFFFVLSTLCYQFLYIVHFWLPLRYSLTFIIYKSIVTFTRIKICIMVWVIVCSWLTAGSFLSSSEFMIMIIRSSRETQYP